MASRRRLPAAYVMVMMTAMASSFVVAFTITSTSSGIIHTRRCTSHFGSTNEDDSATIMSDYMAKSHREKLRAIQAVEERKNSEITALKLEINKLMSSSSSTSSLSSSSSTASIAPPTTLVVANDSSSSSEIVEMEYKLTTYQNWMAKYIVNAQNQKLLGMSSTKQPTCDTFYFLSCVFLITTIYTIVQPFHTQAVKEAELKAEKKFQEKLDQLLSSTTTTSRMLPTTTANAYVISAATVGKSRWGDMEVERTRKTKSTTSSSSSQLPAVVTTSNLTGNFVESSLRTSARTVGTSTTVTTYDQRNANVIASANVGMSRWGKMEAERLLALLATKNNDIAVISTSVSPTTSTATINGATSPMAAALPAVEGRKGVSLDYRLNLGAKLLGVGSVSPSITVAVTSRTPAESITTSTAAYNQRNVQVISSANAGKSRWGRFEVERVAKTTMNVISTASATAVSVAESETSIYDHRNANVLSSARGGMSRWGNLEVERIAIMNGNA